MGHFLGHPYYYDIIFGVITLCLFAWTINLSLGYHGYYATFSAMLIFLNNPDKSEVSETGGTIERQLSISLILPPLDGVGGGVVAGWRASFGRGSFVKPQLCVHCLVSLWVNLLIFTRTEKNINQAYFFMFCFIILCQIAYCTTPLH